MTLIQSDNPTITQFTFGLLSFVAAWFVTPGVDFIKVGRKARIIEIALSKLGARRKARRTLVKSFSKSGRRARIGRKKFMKSTPGLPSS